MPVCSLTEPHARRRWLDAAAFLFIVAALASAARAEESKPKDAPAAKEDAKPEAAPEDLGAEEAGSEEEGSEEEGSEEARPEEESAKEEGEKKIESAPAKDSIEKVDEAPEAQRPRSFSQDDLSIVLHDGSSLKGTLAIASFTIETTYGVLVVPIEEIYEIRFADRLSGDSENALASAIQRLSSPKFQIRERAQAELKGFGTRAVRTLEKAASSAEDLEVRARIEEVIADMSVGVDELSTLRPLEDDEIRAFKFTARGRLVLETLALTTQHGALAIERQHLARINVQRPEQVTRRLTIGPEHTAPGSFFDTGLEVLPGDRIKIAASGAIMLANWGSSFSPDGEPGFGNFRAGIPNGSLVMRIGETGTITVAGSNLDRTARESGKLFLAVAIGDRGSNRESSGEWAVRISIQHATPDEEE